MNPRIFRQYDIRGVVDEDLTDEFAVALGRATGTYFLRRGVDTLSLARDCRLSSERIRDLFADGATSTGCNVVDIGLVPTPVLYYSVIKLKVGAGVMITGSHNPAGVNGFKISLGRTSLYGDELQSLRKLIEERDFEFGRGELTTANVSELYIDDLVGRIRRGPRDIRVVVDAGNGTAGELMLAMLERLGIESIPLYCEMDGRFPNHGPDPILPDNLEDLIHTVKDEIAHLGIALDSDGDRMGVVDSHGEIVPADKLLLIFGRDILRSNPGAAIIGDVKCSQTLFDDITARGGRPIMWKTGHSMIKQKMQEEQALLAGEMSGHMFFAHRYYGFDDALYASLRLIELLSRSEDRLDQLLLGLPKMYSTPEIRLESSDDRKHQIIDRVREIFESDRSVVSVDGVRVAFEGGWGLLRASNTQPVIVLRCEADTPERLDEIKASMESALVEAGGRPMTCYF